MIRPKLEQVDQVGLVDVIGGRKREIHVALDRAKLKAHEISATQVVDQGRGRGRERPARQGQKTRRRSKQETVFRTLGEFKIARRHPAHDRQLLRQRRADHDRQTSAASIDTLEDETSRAFVNGKKSLFLNVFRQSGANTIAVVDDLQRADRSSSTRICELRPGKPQAHDRPRRQRLDPRQRRGRAGVDPDRHRARRCSSCSCSSATAARRSSRAWRFPTR